MKKIKFVARPIFIPIVLISVFFTLLINGCVININNGQTPSPTPTITVAPTPTITVSPTPTPTIDLSTVRFWFCVFPVRACCGFNDSTGQTTDEFQDAVVKVNDIQLPFIVEPGGAKFFNKVLDQPLNTGDTANIELQHPMLGSFNWSATIPNPVPNLISPPDLETMNAWANGDIQTLTLNWPAVSNCDFYNIYVDRFNSDQILIDGKVLNTSGTSIDLNRENLILADSTYAPYFRITIQSVKTINLSYVFNSQSGIFAYSSDSGPLQNF